jgi:23S rRNA A2030 N6-methylase RlmJ
MDYNHSRKAGNQGDVWKHAVLTAVADAIDVGEEVLYVESHSGTRCTNLLPARSGSGGRVV